MSKNKSARLAMITAIMALAPMGLSRKDIELEKPEKPQEWHPPNPNDKKYVILDSNEESDFQSKLRRYQDAVLQARPREEIERLEKEIPSYYIRK